MKGKRVDLFGVLLLLAIVPAAGEKTPPPLRPSHPVAAQWLPVSAVLGYPPPPAAPVPALRPAVAATPASGPAVQGGAPEQTTNYVWRTETVESGGCGGTYIPGGGGPAGARPGPMALSLLPAALLPGGSQARALRPAEGLLLAPGSGRSGLMAHQGNRVRSQQEVQDERAHSLFCIGSHAGAAACPPGKRDGGSAVRRER